MTAAALLSDLSGAGVTVRIDDAGQLKASGDQAALARLLPQIREHKAELMAMLAANDPAPLHRLFLVTRPTGEQFTTSRNPPIPLTEAQADYPDCTVEVQPDLPPAAALTDNDKSLALALLDHWQEDDPVIRRGWLDGLRDPERLAGMRAMAHALGVAVAVTLPPDDRRTCRQCRNLSRNGRCQAAEAGRLPLTGTRYEPDQNALQRCVGYAPGADDPDRRPGKERYPGLHARLWAMAGRAGR
ncbi:hypothetical protein CCR95_20900 [Thiocystis minor]|uniref:hypothetical protein n=1 Tax=Thiocystis minor TaxID=61597 RepID=UPI0019132D8D|nr:hypothetical protein [Thiocystis minor]MBK5966465.1 hypothetical protein [Thiocystis minor]